MMVTNSMPANSPSPSPTKSVTVTQQTPTNAPATNAGFRLHAPVSSSEAVQPDVSSIELNTEDSSDEMLLGNAVPSVNLATQALTPGAAKAPINQDETKQFATVSPNGTSQSANMIAQAKLMFTAPVQENKSGIQTSATNLLKVSTHDLQPLLNQSLHEQISVGNPQSQIPIAQHSNPTSLLAATQAQGAEWSAVRVDTSSGRWGEQMMQVLQDRVTLQAQQNLQEAKIRLDPPELGKLDLLVRVEGDRLSVQINATNAVTREALIQVSERLRAELQEQNFVHVDVNVGSDQGHEQPHHTPESDEISILAAREAQPLQSDTAANYSEHWLNTQA